MPQTKPPIKANPIEPTLRLPKQMKLSPDETALCARLIRVRRQDYWLRYFIEHLLHGCRRRPGRDRAQAEDALKVMTSFINWQNWFDKTAKTWDVLEDFPGLDWYPWDEHDDFRGLTALLKTPSIKKSNSRTSCASCALSSNLHGRRSGQPRPSTPGIWAKRWTGLRRKSAGSKTSEV